MSEMETMRQQIAELSTEVTGLKQLRDKVRIPGSVFAAALVCFLVQTYLSAKPVASGWQIEARYGFAFSENNGDTQSGMRRTY